MKRFARTTALLAVYAFALAACSGGGDEDPLAGDTADGGAIVVGSANFPENVLLAEIYSQALESAGSEVTRQFNIGSREIYYDQVASGAITLVPEYNGALLARSIPTAPPRRPRTSMRPCPNPFRTDSRSWPPHPARTRTPSSSPRRPRSATTW